MSPERKDLEGKTPEEFSSEASYKILGVFAVRREFREVNARCHEAEEEATTQAPKGYVFRIVALNDGALTTVHDGHKPNPWYEERKRGDVAYAPTIDCHRKDGFSWSTYTSWLNGPLDFELPSYIVSRTPTSINNEEVKIDLVSVEYLVAAHARREPLSKIVLEELV